jgi:hypothetical protein
MHDICGDTEGDRPSKSSCFLLASRLFLCFFHLHSAIETSGDMMGICARQISIFYWAISQSINTIQRLREGPQYSLDIS